jgi:hypothetical protein
MAGLADKPAAELVGLKGLLMKKCCKKCLLPGYLNTTAMYNK